MSNEHGFAGLQQDTPAHTYLKRAVCDSEVAKAGKCPIRTDYSGIYFNAAYIEFVDNKESSVV